jgi:trehalose 6-phosphate synthase/phosphatase
LWPAFHNIDLLDLSTSGWLSDPNGTNASDWDQSRLEDWWQAFNEVNAQFCTALSGFFRPGDIMWIHDYHLSLLPKILHEWETERYGKCITRKVFFLHIPFPTSQIFRELECGESLLQGMLHADVVGFHAFDHARHFLNAAKRILGLNYDSIAGGLIGVNFQGKTVLVSMSNVSIEPRMVDAAMMLPSVTEARNALKKKHSGRVIIGGVDIGQRLSGVALKFLAFERLLQDYPVWQSRLVMVQRMLLPGSRKADEQATVNELRAIVKRLKDRFGTSVIDYEEISGSSLPLDQRLGLWKASDVLMSTPIREGLNHWPMEFIYAHKEPEKPGIVITSEFSAVSSILNGALRVNPFDIQMSIITLDKALSMELPEREGRRFRDIDFVGGSPSDKWVKNVLRDLRDATSRQVTASQSETNSQSQTPYGTPNPKAPGLIDSTAAFLNRESNLAFSRLSMSTLQRAYNATKRRVIFTDFNGTIVMKEPPGKYLKREILGSSGNKPPPAVIEALEQLVNDPRNIVYVVSGDSSENVLSALGHIPRLGLAVSNGGRYAPPVSAEYPQRRWLTFDLGVDWDAVKRVALPILSKYTARTNGSFVKLTSLSLGWSYYSCDPELGGLQAAHLVLELENELRAFDVRFVTLKGIVEIVPRKLNKGLLVKKVLQEVSAQYPEGVDFILCMGDDISDEKMFTSVFSFIAALGDEARPAGPPVLRDDGSYEPSVPANAVIPDPQYAFTVAVGKKPSHASTYVNSAAEVASLLVMLASGDLPQEGTWDQHNSEHLFD